MDVVMPTAYLWPNGNIVALGGPSNGNRIAIHIKLMANDRANMQISLCLCLCECAYVCVMQRDYLI